MVTLVLYSLHRFGDIASFCAPDPTRIPSYLEGFHLGPDRLCWGQPKQKP